MNARLVLVVASGLIPTMLIAVVQIIAAIAAQSGTVIIIARVAMSSGMILYPANHVTGTTVAGTFPALSVIAARIAVIVLLRI